MPIFCLDLLFFILNNSLKNYVFVVMFDVSSERKYMCGYDNLIPVMIAACQWSNGLDNNLYLSMSGKVPTSTSLNYIVNDSFVADQYRRSYMFMLYCC